MRLVYQLRRSAPPPSVVVWLRQPVEAAEPRHRARLRRRLSRLNAIRSRSSTRSRPIAVIFRSMRQYRRCRPERKFCCRPPNSGVGLGGNRASGGVKMRVCRLDDPRPPLSRPSTRQRLPHRALVVGSTGETAGHACLAIACRASCTCWPPVRLTLRQLRHVKSAVLLTAVRPSRSPPLTTELANTTTSETLPR